MVSALISASNLHHMNPVAQEAVAAVRNAAHELVVFSKLERIVAAVCMGTPFFLILADSQDRIAVWSIVIGTLTVMAIPLVVAFGAFKINALQKTANGVVAFVVILVAVLSMFSIWYLTLPRNFRIRDSISAYVSMDNAQLFGLLLTIASMLFLFNGAVYFNTVPSKSTKKHGKWYNVVLGVSLLGVVLFPCTNPSLVILHYAFAITFYGGSSVVIAFFNDEEYKQLSRFIAACSFLSFMLYLANTYWLDLRWLSWLTLFWAETIALWVIGIHYILESLGSIRRAED
jgi:hypothetical protein